MRTLLPYVGDRMQHFGGEGRGGHTLTTYGADTTGKVAYRFNSLGFRADEPERDARACLFASGCSYTFGVAVEYEDTWVSRFRDRYAERLGAPASEVSVQNFAQGGASNDYVARTLLAQIGRCRPDAVVALFTYAVRAELVTETGFRTIGPWALDRAKELDRLSPAEQEYVGLAIDYYRHFSAAGAYARTLSALLLVQSFLRARRIPHVLGWIEHDILDDATWRAHEATGPLIELLDRSTICPVSIMDPALLVDVGADQVHPGPRAHAAFAERMFATYDAAHASFDS
jgi:hypothetical protein